MTKESLRMCKKVVAEYQFLIPIFTKTAPNMDLKDHSGDFALRPQILRKEF
jgi:hypothetical protein